MDSQIRDNSVSICDTCGRPVPPENDAARFDSLLLKLPFFPRSESRHMLPVIENGGVVCSGSPSRAQYIEGQPRDSRTEFAYRPEREAKYREVFRAMQESKR